MPRYSKKRDTSNDIPDEELLGDMEFVQEEIHKGREEKKSFSTVQENNNLPPISFNVQEAPTGIFDVKPQRNYVDEVLRKIGVTPNEDSPTEKLKDEFKYPSQLSLTDKQAKWCEEATGYAIFLASGLFSFWELFGHEYGVLKPDWEIKYKIVAPLVRIYARTVKKLGIINPNYVDLAASTTAMIEYAMICYNNIQMIHAYKRGEIEDGTGEYFNSGNGPSNNGSTGGAINTWETTATHASSTKSPLSNSTGKNGSRNVQPPGTTDGKLTPEQLFQRDKLAQLRVTDSQVRSRLFNFNGKV